MNWRCLLGFHVWLDRGITATAWDCPIMHKPHRWRSWGCLRCGAYQDQTL